MTVGPRPVSHYQVVNGLRLHHLDWPRGPGRPLVLLPGGNLPASSFERVATILSTTHRCLALDQRGHGGSEWSEALEYLVEHFAEDLAAWLKLMGLDAPVLVGHSLGGLVALSYVSRHPNDVSGLVMLDVVPRMEASGAGDLLVAGGALVQHLGLDHRRRFASLEELVELALEQDPTRTREELRARLGARVRVAADGSVTWKHDPRRYRPEVHDGPEDLARLWPLGSAVPCPTLVVRAGDSTILSHDQAERFVAEVPRGELVTVAGAGHNIHQDAPDEIAAVLRSWLAATPD